MSSRRSSRVRPRCKRSSALHWRQISAPTTERAVVTRQLVFRKSRRRPWAARRRDGAAQSTHVELLEQIAAQNRAAAAAAAAAARRTRLRLRRALRRSHRACRGLGGGGVRSKESCDERPLCESQQQQQLQQLLQLLEKEREREPLQERTSCVCFVLCGNAGARAFQLAHTAYSVLLVRGLEVRGRRDVVPRDGLRFSKRKVRTPLRPSRGTL